MAFLEKAAMIPFIVGLAAGLFIIPIARRVRDVYEEIVLDWWYNRKRS